MQLWIVLQTSPPLSPTKTRDSITLASGPSNYVISDNPDHQGFFLIWKTGGELGFCYGTPIILQFFCLSNNIKSYHTKQKNLTTVII